MMKKFAFIIMAAFLVQSANADSIAKDTGVAYYFGFNIQRITGIHEEEMESQGCKYETNREGFLSVIQTTKQADSSLYCSRDVRAKVIFQGELPYFISRDGLCRHGDKFYYIDKDKFEKNLKLISCPKQSGG